MKVVRRCGIRLADRDDMLEVIAEIKHRLEFGGRDAFVDELYVAPEARGSGLGLSMVWGFVKQSRGHLRICSERGHGTTVTLYLPRVAADDQASATAPAAAPRGGSETILLVEDDPLVREHVAGQLGALGYRVLRAADGPEALALLEHERGIDLLFTDVVMPGGMNGRDLAAAVRRLRPGIKVVLTSGFTDAELRSEDREHFLGKPYRWQELAAKLRAVLGERGA